MDSSTAIPPWYFDELTIVNVLRIFIASVAIIGHTFIISLFLKFKKLRSTQYNHLVLMLVVSDLFLAIGVFFRGAYAAYSTQRGMREFSPIICIIINNGIQGTGMNFSQICILGISIDRFMAIYRPVHYSKRQNMVLFKIIFIFGVVYVGSSIFLSYFHSNTNKIINVCSAGAVSGPYSGYFSTVAGSLMIILLIGIYFSTLFLLYRYEKTRNTQITSALRFQRKVFVSASLVLLCYAIFWAGPFTFNILGLIFNYDINTKSYVSVAIGFGNAINSGCSVFVYLFKYHVINECAKSVLFKKNQVDKVTNVPSVQVGKRSTVTLTRK